MKKIALAFLLSSFIFCKGNAQSYDSLYIPNLVTQGTLAITFKVLLTDTFTYVVYDRWGRVKLNPLNDTLLNPGTYSITSDTKALVDEIYFISFSAKLSSRKTGRLVIQNTTTSINKNVNGERISFSVYPNPTTQTIKTQTDINFDTVLINDLSGKQITSLKSTANTAIDISGLAAGEYVFTFIHDKKMVYSTRISKVE